jgi:hypothetical protein
MSGAQWAHFFAQVRSQPTHVVIEGRPMVEGDVQQSIGVSIDEQGDAAIGERLLATCSRRCVSTRISVRWRASPGAITRLSRIMIRPIAGSSSQPTLGGRPTRSKPMDTPWRTTSNSVHRQEIRERFGIGDSSLYRMVQRHGVALE